MKFEMTLLAGWPRRWTLTSRSHDKAVVNGRHPAALSQLLRQPKGLPIGQPIHAIKICLKTTTREVNCPKLIAWVIANLQAHRQTISTFGMSDSDRRRCSGWCVDYSQKQALDLGIRAVETEAVSINVF